MIPLSPTAFAEAAANLYDAMLGEGLADLRRMPSTVIDEGPQRTVHRYHPAEAAPRRRRASALPVLLVPPLAAPAICFDLRRGCSVAEHLVHGGPADLPRRLRGDRVRRPRARPRALDRGRRAGAIRAASEDAGGRPVQVVGWCLGGILSLLALAADPELPVASAALIASPFDFSKVPLVAPLRPIAAVTGGAGITQLYRLLGGAPAPLVKRGYQLAGIDKYLMKPWTVLSNLHDRELLAQIEAVDAFMDRMHAYPGRTFGQLYHRFFRTNDLADGRFAITGATLDLADVRVPVLSVAGRGDGIAPIAACHHVESLLPHARVELATAPGGHLGVLTGRAAAGTTWQILDDVPRRAGSCKAPCTAGKAARSRCLSGYPSRPMRALALLPTLLLLLVLAVPAAAQTPPPPEQRIAPGVKAGGLDVGNLTVGEAAVKLQQTYGPPLYNPVAVHVGGQTFRLTPKQSKLKFDTVLTAKRAYHAGVANPAADVPLATSFDKARVRTFARRVAREVYVAPRDATIRITLRHIYRRKSVTGRALNVKAPARRDQAHARASPTAHAHPAPGPHDPQGARDRERPRARPTRPSSRSTAQLQAAPVQAAEVLQELRRRRRPAGLPDADGALPDLQQAGQPGLDRAELAVGGRARGHDDARRLGRRTRCGPAGWGSPAASASTGPRRSTRSAAVRRTAASACASRT